MKEIHTILTETLVSFLPGRAKDLSAPLCKSVLKDIHAILTETLVSFVSGSANDLSAPLYKSVLKEIHAILTETLVCFLPDRAKHVSAPLYKSVLKEIHAILTETLGFFPSWSGLGLISTPVNRNILEFQPEDGLTRKAETRSYYELLTIIYTGCFTTLGHNCRR